MRYFGAKSAYHTNDLTSRQVNKANLFSFQSYNPTLHFVSSFLCSTCFWLSTILQYIETWFTESKTLLVGNIFGHEAFRLCQASFLTLFLTTSRPRFSFDGSSPRSGVSQPLASWHPASCLQFPGPPVPQRTSRSLLSLCPRLLLS